MSNAVNNRKLKIALAITVDSMSPFVYATYNLAGDGLLTFTANCHIPNLQAAVNIEHYPNLLQ